MPNQNRCVRCGVIIPEGTQVCYGCLKDILGVDCEHYQVVQVPRYDHTCDMFINHTETVCLAVRGSRSKRPPTCTCGGDPNKCDKNIKGESEAMTDETMDINTYIKHKIKILKQLCIRLTNEQLEHMLSLKTEIAVDNYAHDLIVKGDWE